MGRFEAMRVDPLSLDVEQPRQLAGMRSQHRRSASLDRLEAEEGVGVDDRGQVGLLEQPPDQRLRLFTAPEARTERQRFGASGGVEGFLQGALDRFEQAHLDDRQRLARRADTDVPGVGAERRFRSEADGAGQTGRAADHKHRT